MNTVELYARCSDGFTARCAKADGRWSAPSPLPGWDVRALVHHVVAEERWTPPLLAGSTIAEVGNALDGDLLGLGPMGPRTEPHGNSPQARLLALFGRTV